MTAIAWWAVPQAGPAAADLCEGGVFNSSTGTCDYSNSTRTPPEPTDASDAGPARPTKPASTRPAGQVRPRRCAATNPLGEKVVDCSTSNGWWSDELNCRVQLADPQPPKTDPVWEENQGGAIYKCTLVPGSRVTTERQVFPSTLIWSDKVPEGPQAPVDPEQVARNLLARLGIAKPTIGTAPTSASMGVVGLPVWVWVEDPTTKKVGPLSDSDSERGVRVALSAKLTSITYDFGAKGTRDTIICTAPGVPFERQYADAPPPRACTYRYLKPGNYRITAIANWEVTWSGGARTGTIRTTMTDTAVVTIGENQVVNGTPRKKSKVTF